MAQSAAVRHDVGYLSTLPLGTIIAWHRDFDPDRPAPLPPGWVECDGRTLDDPESPFHDRAIPNLNLPDQDDLLAGRDGGAFLRGASRSGEFQQDELQTHSHDDRGHRHPRNTEDRPERVIQTDDNIGNGHLPEGGDGNSNPVGTDTGTGHARLGEPVPFEDRPLRHGAETRPVNMSVIWIMKVKQVTAARALPAVLAHEDAPHGQVYVDRKGRVGVGTSEPRAALEVAGPVRANRFEGRFEGDGSRLTDVPCTCFEILASGEIGEPGRITTIELGTGFIGLLTVVAQGGGQSYTSIHHYLATGWGAGPERPAQLSELGEGLAGHFDEPVRVDVVLEPAAVGAVQVVARAASAGGGMTYKVLARRLEP